MRLIPILLLAGLVACSSPKEPKSDFTFVFMTDIHMTPERNAPEGFTKAIGEVNRLAPDLVITGGDLIMDALGQTRGKADSLYALYKSHLGKFNMPVYNTVGNHELFAFYNKAIDTLDPDYGEGMFRRHLGKPWQSFNHKGWHYILMKSIEQTPSRGYYGRVNPEQVEWLRQDLAAIPDTMPVVVSVHIPLVTAYNQWQEGGLFQNGHGSVITNGKEVMDLLRKKNLKLVLQGHQHYYEDLYMDGVRFVTGGAVSSAWWNGRNGPLEEGFVLLKVRGGEIEAVYHDYGWEVKK